MRLNESLDDIVARCKLPITVDFQGGVWWLECDDDRYPVGILYRHDALNFSRVYRYIASRLSEPSSSRGSARASLSPGLRAAAATPVAAASSPAPTLPGANSGEQSPVFSSRSAARPDNTAFTSAATLGVPRSPTGAERPNSGAAR